MPTASERTGTRASSQSGESRVRLPGNPRSPGALGGGPRRSVAADPSEVLPTLYITHWAPAGRGIRTAISVPVRRVDLIVRTPLRNSARSRMRSRPILSSSVTRTAA